jgi:CHRD domain
MVRVVATNLPAAIAGPSTGAYINVQDPDSVTGLTGPIVVHFERTGLNTGLVAEGTTTNPTLAAAILANPENYYVNVHTTACPTGTIRGQLG